MDQEDRTDRHSQHYRRDDDDDDDDDDDVDSDSSMTPLGLEKSDPEEEEERCKRIIAKRCLKRNAKRAAPSFDSDNANDVPKVTSTVDDMEIHSNLSKVAKNSAALQRSYKKKSVSLPAGKLSDKAQFSLSPGKLPDRAKFSFPPHEPKVTKVPAPTKEEEERKGARQWAKFDEEHGILKASASSETISFAPLKKKMSEYHYHLKQLSKNDYVIGKLSIQREKTCFII